MKTMNPADDNKETEKLSQILQQLQNLYFKKQDQLEELKIEITEIQDAINNLNSLISKHSFSSADQLYSKQVTEAGIAGEDYFKEDLPVDKFKGTKIKRKIFSSEEQKESDLLCILNLYDFKKVEIKFIDPAKRSIKETSEKFISIFLRGALINIKERNPNLSISYNFYKNTDLIEYINLSNLHSIKDYDIITSKIRELLAEENS
jgi:hypothetical protein